MKSLKSFFLKLVASFVVATMLSSMTIQIVFADSGGGPALLIPVGLLLQQAPVDLQPSTTLDVAAPAADVGATVTESALELGAEGMIDVDVSLVGEEGVEINFESGTEVEGADPTGGVIPPPSLLDVGGLALGTPFTENLTILGGFDTSTSGSLRFSRPVEINVPVDDCPEAGVRVLHIADDGSETWLTAECSDGVVTFETSSFSQFIVVEGELAVFTDIENHWSEDFILDLQAKGIVSGKTETTFAPDDNLTRAELTKIALNAFGIEAGGEATFSDVGADEWYAPYIAAAKENEIVGGYEDGTFKPNAPVTRAEALKILIAASGLDTEGAEVASFTDVKADSWFAMYVNYAFENEIVGGYSNGTFGPNRSITRGEIAKMTSLMLEL